MSITGDPGVGDISPDSNLHLHSVSEPNVALEPEIISSEDESEDKSANNQKQTFPSLDPSSKLVKALSESGEWYDTLWPIIFEVATHKQRKKCLRYVNRFFARHVRRIESGILSDDAKKEYHGIETSRRQAPRPVHLDPEVLKDVYWASWGAKRLDFGSVANFYEFCALGDVDPDAGASQYDLLALRVYENGPNPLHEMSDGPQMSWIFISRNRDLVFETSLHSPNLEAYAHRFGITGRADKVERMYRYVAESKKIHWDELMWGARGYI